ncbi:hypothetical protein GF359_00015 [candidate division WOR-3 bacterium]|uniref:T9SS type A sorting domain-containing protein n=1 Tax=candidate division WOR-3 bacterium TaxID=2052148 RepID=A0A9D5K7L1_UNCW3|nr:hypothetical protein [candidate division WOR-3 bacterium]MBD3363579.1 hypothetical protein [candidate division WOR-3 bacterium]
MKRFVCLSGLVLIPLTGFAGWTHTFGQDQDDVGYCVQETSDGGYIIAGHSGITMGGWIIKTDAHGDAIWTSAPFGFGGGTAYSITETSDGNYVATGFQAMYDDGKYHLALVKLNPQGQEVWFKIDADWVGHDSSGGIGYSVHQTPDGGYVVAGSRQPFIFTDTIDVWLIKTDSAGELEWEKKHGGLPQDVGRCVRSTSDGCYIIAGYTEYSTPSSPWSYWVLKTDDEGDTVWISGMPDWYFGRAYWVEETSDDGFISAGYVFPFEDGKHHLFLLKMDSEGDTLWSRMDLDWLAENGGDARCVRETSDGGFIVSGFRANWYEEIEDLWLIKTDMNADTQWTRIYGGSQEDMSHCVSQTADGGFIVVGATSSLGSGGYDVWLVKTDAQGDTVSVSEGPQIITGNLDIPVSIGQEIVLKYSNHSRGFHAQIFDASGRKADEIHSPLSQGAIRWGEGFDAGVYFIEALSSEGRETRKVVLIR